MQAAIESRSTVPQHRQQFFQAIVCSLTDSLAVIDQTGEIRFVNRSWEEFGRCNGAVVTSGNYLSVCAAADDESSRESLDGLRDLLQGKIPSFSLEYPCHSPTTQRWFILDARRMEWPGEPLYLITHKNITRRRLAEEAARALSLTDQLTGLANRRHFDSFLNQEWNARSRSQDQMSLILFDIDHFKECNDTYGHLAGDQCLKSVAEVLKKFGNRPRDLAARYGGEEFALILGDSDELSASRIANEVRNQVRSLEIPLSHDGKFVTISAGVASARPIRTQSLEEFLSKADQALYLAKSRGRDRVERSADRLPLTA